MAESQESEGRLHTEVQLTEGARFAPQVSRPQMRLLRREAGSAAEAPGRQLAEGFAPGAGAWTFHAQGSSVLGKHAVMIHHVLVTGMTPVCRLARL